MGVFLFGIFSGRGRDAPGAAVDGLHQIGRKIAADASRILVYDPKASGSCTACHRRTTYARARAAATALGEIAFRSPMMRRLSARNIGRLSGSLGTALNDFRRFRESRPAISLVKLFSHVSVILREPVHDGTGDVE
jgi:hypothetical protein